MFGMDFVNLNNPQPDPNAGSLCSAMATYSPFESTNWIKIPCEYPIFRSGVICKKQAEGESTLH